MKGNKQPWTVKAMNKAAGLFGLSVVPSRRLGGADPFMQFFGLSVVWGVWGDVDFIEKGYMANSGLYSIISRITRTASTAPFKVYRIKDKKKFAQYKAWTGVNATKESMRNAMFIKSLVYEEDTSHPLNALIENPNPWQGGSDFTANSIGFKLLTGNRFLFTNKLDMGANAGQVTQVYNLPPQKTAVLGDGSLFGVAGYRLMLGSPVDIPLEMMIHSKYWNPDINAMGSHLRGLSPLLAGAKNLDITDAGEKRSAAMLKNAGAAGILFNKTATDQDMSTTQKAEMKQKVNDEIMGMDNAGTIGIANGDLGYLNFSMTAQGMELLPVQKYSFQQLCNIYGVPNVLFNSDNSSYNNIVEAKKELITMAVMPELASLRTDWNRIAAGYGDDNIYVDYDLTVYPELQEDMEKTARFMSMAWWITPNEKRLSMYLDEDQDEPMMNEYLVPSGLSEISTLDPNKLNDAMDAVDTQLTNGSNDPNAIDGNLNTNV